MAKIIWTPSALAQMDRMLAPITEENPEMGASLARRIRDGVKRLEAFPESSPFYQAPVRRLSVVKLPYGCYYVYRNEMVYIITVRHDKQQQPEL